MVSILDLLDDLSPLSHLTERVVLAANRVRVAVQSISAFTSRAQIHRESSPATPAADTDDGDRGAGQADERVNVMDDDADGLEDAGRGGVARLLDGVAALDGTRAAGARGRAVRRGGGDGKDCKGGDGGELGEHLEAEG